MSSGDKVSLFNGFALDRRRGCLVNSEQPVHLRPQSYRVLDYLVEHSGRLISKDTLIEAVWEGRAVTDGAVGKCIEELRGVFGEEGGQYLQNVRGRGYIFDLGPHPEVQIFRGQQSEEIDILRVLVEEESDTSPTAHKNIATQTRRQLTTRIIVGFVLLLMLPGGYWLYTLKQPTTKITSIAVLPLRNESGNDDVEYLSDGMTESLINSLSRLPGLTVKSRNSVFQYKDREIDARTAASSLSVQAVLNGRFVQRGDDVKLYISLVDGTSGNQIWGEQYARKLNQLSSLERETAADIARQLNSQLNAADKQRLASGDTENNEAYLTYLKGRYYWNKGSVDGLEKSLEFFQKAIDIDSTYSLSYAGLAHYYGYAAAIGMLPPEENWRRAEASVKKALELDDSRAETYNALVGVQLYYQRDWTSAERSFKQGLALNSNSAEITRHYAKCLVLFGRNNEAIEQITHTLKLEPLSLSYNLDAARISLWSGQYEKAINHLENALDLAPDSLVTHDLLGTVYEKMGDQKRAIEEWCKVLEFSGDANLAGKLRRTFERTGFEAAQRIRGEHKLNMLNNQLKKGRYVGSGEFVIAYTLIGDKERAFAWLEKATEERNRFAIEFKINPVFDMLRNDPRFQQFADRVKIL